ncbi:MAG: hypothetical protein ACK4SY_10585 [Pyrobaculum sp.]
MSEEVKERILKILTDPDIITAEDVANAFGISHDFAVTFIHRYAKDLFMKISIGAHSMWVKKGSVYSMLEEMYDVLGYYVHNVSMAFTLKEFATFVCGKRARKERAKFLIPFFLFIYPPVRRVGRTFVFNPLRIEKRYDPGGMYVLKRFLCYT